MRSEKVLWILFPLWLLQCWHPQRGLALSLYLCASMSTQKSGQADAAYSLLICCGCFKFQLKNEKHLDGIPERGGGISSLTKCKFNHHVLDLKVNSKLLFWWRKKILESFFFPLLCHSFSFFFGTVEWICSQEEGWGDFVILHDQAPVTGSRKEWGRAGGSSQARLQENPPSCLHPVP